MPYPSIQPRYNYVISNIEFNILSTYEMTDYISNITETWHLSNALESMDMEEVIIDLP